MDNWLARRDKEATETSVTNGSTVKDEPDEIL